MLVVDTPNCGRVGLWFGGIGTGPGVVGSTSSYLSRGGFMEGG